MELLFQDVVQNLIKIKLPENWRKQNSFYVKITARKVQNSKSVRGRSRSSSLNDHSNSMSIRNNNIETTNSINVVQSSNQEKHLENTNYQNLPKSQSSNIENPHPTSNKLEIKDKKQIFNKNLDSDYKSCSQKLISLVTSILFKNKVVLFETIDDWVSRDIMPLRVGVKRDEIFFFY